MYKISRYFPCLLLIAVLATSLIAAEKTTPHNTLGRAIAVADYGGNKVYLVDASGKITWQQEANRPQDVWVLPNGNILFTHVRGAIEMTPEKKVVWKYSVPETSEVHACQPLPNGLVLVAESGPMQILEVDRDGKVVKTVKLQTNTKNTHMQMRGVRKLSNGHYLVGQYTDGVVREYDGDGKIVTERKHSDAFGAVRLPNGHTLYPRGDAHCLVECDADGKVVWQLNENDLPGCPLRFVAGVQRLPSGETVICNWGGHGHIGEQPQIIIITPDKKVVGELFDFEKFSTISGIHVLGDNADATKFEVCR